MLARRGHEVHLLTFHDPVLEDALTAEDNANLRMTYLPTQLKWSPVPLARRVRRLLDALRPDVWHAHIAIPYGVTAAIARQHPFFLSTHGSDVYFEAWASKVGRFRPLLPPGVGRLAFRVVHAGLASAADKVVVFSPDMMKLLPRLGYPRSRLVPCYLGIDTDLFRRRDRPPAAEEFRIVCTRNLEPLYDHATLLEAAARLQAQGVRVSLRLAGSGSLRRFLEDYARRLGIADRVEFLGVVLHRQLPRLLSESDVMVSPSRSDTTAMSVLEAMSCGLPVVATSVGSLPERIVPGRNGFLFRPGDVSELTAALGRLAADPALRDRMGADNEREVRAKFNLRETINRLEFAYEQAMSAPV